MKKIQSMLILAFLLSGCGGSGRTYPTVIPATPAATLADIKLPEAAGVEVKSDKKVLVDYSNVSQGYIMAKTLGSDHKRIKIQVNRVTVNAEGEAENAEAETYTYDILEDNRYNTFPLNEGSGQYEIRVLENVGDDRYSLLFSFITEVELESEVLPFLYPNQVVDYDQNNAAIAKSFELTDGKQTDLERVLSIYKFVTGTIDYDWDKAEEVKGAYVLPIVDETLSIEKGICFDYASLMAAMLRVQQIPTRVVTGYVKEGYHAWVEVYIPYEGWINPKIYFDDQEWTLIDPTYDAAQQNYKGSYQVKYRY